jgi:hypothetical protein
MKLGRGIAIGSTVTGAKRLHARRYGWCSFFRAVVI